uniref:BHLH domain-containing protein n=1 Tax=Rhabditophanes sp. KR3021 TaxID=114890 RepID=A0AC35TIV0_9BILA
MSTHQASSGQSLSKKKETHLRCERQRREAINNGYGELKELLPKSLSSQGCKTTNASILFRSFDYIGQLQEKISSQDEELDKLKANYAALEMISNQYENLSKESSAHVVESRDQKMLVKLLEMSFDSFKKDVDTEDYTKLTQTLITWVEKMDYKVGLSVEPIFEPPNTEALLKECAWLQESKVPHVFKELEFVIREICKKLNISSKLNTKFLNSITEEKVAKSCFGINQSEKHMLVSKSGADQLKATVFLLGENVCQVEISFKHSKYPSGVFRSTAMPNVQWKLQQLQDTGNYCVKIHQTLVKALESITKLEQDKSWDLASADFVMSAITQLTDLFKRAKNAMILPRKKTLAELENFQPTKFFNPPLPPDYLISVYISASKVICATYQTQSKVSIPPLPIQNSLNISQAECIVPQFMDVLYVLNVASGQLNHLEMSMKTVVCQLNKYVK